MRPIMISITISLLFHVVLYMTIALFIDNSTVQPAVKTGYSSIKVMLNSQKTPGLADEKSNSQNNRSLSQLVLVSHNSFVSISLKKYRNLKPQINHRATNFKSKKSSKMRTQENRAALSKLAALHALNQPPLYPLKARKFKQQGKVILAITITPIGVVSKAWVIQSSGHFLLDDAALHAVRLWNFTPDKRFEQKQNITIEQAFNFKIR